MSAAQLAVRATSGAWLNVTTAAGLGIALFLAGVALGLWAARVRAGRPSPAPAPGGEADDAALVRSLIELAERTRGSALQQTVAAAMTACGLAADYPLGEAFDASRHHAVDTDGTADPAKDMRICEVERPGYTRWGSSVRAADVIVLRYRPGRQGNGAR
jgi:hypothetical protein